MVCVRFVRKTCENVFNRLFIDDFSGAVSVSLVTRRLAINEFEGTWHEERVAHLWTDCWYVSHFYGNTWLGDQLWSRIGGETANILWCRHWPEKLEYKEPDGLIYCHSLKKIFLEQNPEVPSSSLLSLHTLRLVARYVKPADVMGAGERNCMLFECIYTSPEREKSQAIFHCTKCHTQIVTSKSPFHPFEQKCAESVYSVRQISSISNDLFYWM